MKLNRQGFAREEQQQITIINIDNFNNHNYKHKAKINNFNKSCIIITTIITIKTQTTIKNFDNHNYKRKTKIKNFDKHYQQK